MTAACCLSDVKSKHFFFLVSLCVSRLILTSSPMVWLTLPSCCFLKTPFVCLPPTMRGSSTCWVRHSLCLSDRTGVCPNLTRSEERTLFFLAERMTLYSPSQGCVLISVTVEECAQFSLPLTGCSVLTLRERCSVLSLNTVVYNIGFCWILGHRGFFGSEQERHGCKSVVTETENAKSHLPTL